MKFVVALDRSGRQQNQFVSEQLKGWTVLVEKNKQTKKTKRYELPQ